MFELLAMTQAPGSGAAREPDFADGVQDAVIACMLVQLPESWHGTESRPEPAWNPAMSGTEDAGRCSVCPATDDS